MKLSKPAEIFDRDVEWAELVRFAADDRPGATLGVVSGRRRQGKTLLLYELARATDGFYFGATEATPAESLRRLGEALGRHTDAPGPLRLEDWSSAVDALLALGQRRPVTVVIDEFPYLARSSRDLPSIIQHALTPGRVERTESRTRLLLCGSALSFMGGLLAGSAPLRGRAGLELPVPPLDYRAAATFWGIVDPALAARVFAIVGGTPAYRREYVQDDVPDGPDDFDDWVVRAVLNPARPLFREARYLLAEDPDLRDTALYHSVLSAVAEGNGTRGGIAGYIGRKATDLQHPLTVLEDAGLLIREPDPLRSGRSRYRIAEPLITFYQAVMRPSWTALEQRRGADVWRRSNRRYSSGVLGPAFEEIVRQWALRFAAPETFGGVVAEASAAVLTDPSTRTSLELDLVAFGEPPFGDGPRPLLAIGEVKWGRTLGLPELDRLSRARDLLAARPGLDVRDARLLLASAAGFTDELRHAAGQRPDVVLVDPSRLYSGD
ncbi:MULTISPECIES: AAA family ATPase [Micromonospora]|uniref:AAA family ATPase n=1 Tax=Micromonospora TaxID=1873 RepID=UPI001EE8FF4D|nr:MULTISPECIES: ATP-binding protein [Micromonospora]MCG5448543.1 ATP-binding protein [Micromonospora hortensis]MCX5119379.1 ATP-binding protein [Micromonospora sp. NBC_00362]WTI08576.1 ATP-binding protein [Micromonospora sp. NBC_00821]